MTKTATIQAMPRPRGVLTPYMQAEVERLGIEVVEAQEAYRSCVVTLLTIGGCSFSEVSKATGLSTNTLQRWKREAGK